MQVTIPELTYQFQSPGIPGYKNHVPPLYDHDCKSCTYRGRLTFEGKDYDLYTCGNRSLVARASSDGPDYSSAPIELSGGYICAFNLTPAWNPVEKELQWCVSHAAAFALIAAGVMESRVTVRDDLLALEKDFAEAK